MKGKENLLDIILIFLILFVSDDSIIFGSNSDTRFFIIKYIFFVGLLVFCISKIWIESIEIKTKSLWVLVFFVISIIVTSVANWDIIPDYVYRIVMLVLGFLICHIMNYERMIKAFTFVMQMLSRFSLTVFFIEVFSSDLLQVFPIIKDNHLKKFYNLGLAVVPVVNHGNPRNYGMFTEPGKYVVFLVMAFFFLLYAKKGTVFDKLVLIITILSTKSTTGYVALGFIVISYILLSTKTKKDLLKQIFTLIFVAFVFNFLLNYTEILYSTTSSTGVFNKIGKTNSMSFISRFSSVTTNLTIMLNKPLVGAGITRLYEDFQNLTYSKYGIFSEHNTNAILIQFSTYGLTFGLLYLWNFLFSAIKQHGKIIGLIFFITLQIMLIGQNISTNIILNTLLFMWTSESFNQSVSNAEYEIKLDN